ncbi:preprotein translocase subunit YajC [Chloroflexota bacterium]
MNSNRILNLVLIAGLLLTLVTIGGCAPTEEGGISGIAPLLILLALIFGMFYFLMIRPMRQREKQHDQMVLGLEKGDTVITAGGIYGKVESIDEDSVVLRVESGATIRVTKGGLIHSQGDETIG